MLVRPDVAAPESEEFLLAVGHWFQAAAARFGPEFIEEPSRLLHAKEYRAAVIAAISLLEVFLRKRLDVPGNIQGRRATLPALLEIAHRQEVLGDVSVKTVLDWLHTRNQVVHSQRLVSKSTAAAIVKGVLRVVQRQ